jgi:hypothetical protein
MRLTVPSLSGTQCVLLTVCGEIQKDDKSLPKILRGKRRSLSYKIGAKGDLRFVRLILGGGEHFHVDIATVDYFDEVPKIKGTEKKLRETLAPLFGFRIELEVTGVFRVPIDELPAVIAATKNFTVDRDGVNIRMTGGVLSIVGAEVNEIRWSINEIDKRASVRMEAIRESFITETYLKDSFEIVKDSFDAFMQTGVLNARI